MEFSKSFKKFTYVFLAFAIIIMGIYIAGNKEVKAAEDLTESEDGNYSYMIYSEGMENSIPEAEGYLFAGWYKDENCTTRGNALKNGDVPGEGNVAKFVKADVLSVRAQATIDKVTNTNVIAHNGKYLLRFISSVDNTDYQNVGFKVTYTVDGKTKTGTFTTKNVYSRIYATSGDKFSYSPKVLSTKANAFITAKLPLDETGERSISTEFKVQAFWETFDGTRVYGEERYISYNDATNGQVLKLHVANALDNPTYALEIDGNSITGVSGTKLDSNNVKLTLPTGTSKSDLNSVSTLVLTQTPTEGDAVVDEMLYRNLSSGYNPATAVTVADIADASWYDKYSASEDEFIIATNADLYGLDAILKRNINLSNKTVYLASDVTFNTGDATTWTSASTGLNAWNPLGKGGWAFNGTFDGQMCSISGIYCSETTANAGLFNKVNLNGEVKNLKIANSYLYNSAGRVAALTGETASGAKINTVYVGSDVTVVSGGNDTGGIVGYDVGGTITNCWNAATVTSTGIHTGGIIGRANYNTCTITDCLNTGTVKYEGATQHVSIGGIVGAEKNGTSTTLNITNVLNLAKPIVNTSHTDPRSYSSILGYKDGEGEITNAYDASGFTSKPYNNTAQIVVNVEDITGTDASVKTALTGFDFDTEKVWKLVEGSTPILTSFESKESSNGWYDTSWYGDGTASTFVLYDAEDLYGLAQLSLTNNFSNKTIKLGNDIVLNMGDAEEWATKAPTYGWSPIGKGGKAFNGTFDGNMKTISGIYCSETTANAGLFNKVNLNGEVKNLKIANSYFYNSAGKVAALTGETASGAKINTVYVGSDVTVVSGGNDTGGIVGYDVGGTITNCWNAATVTSTGIHTGGIIGRANYNTCTITDCLNTGTVKYEGATQHVSIGGIVGAEKNGTSTTLNITNVLNLAKPIVNTSHTDPRSYSSILGYKDGEGEITNAYDASGFTSNPYNMDAPSSVYAANIIGTIGDVSGTLAGFDFDTVWKEVEGGTPVLSAFQNESSSAWFDISWYGDGSAETFTLTDKEDLYGFAVLAKVNNFSNKTIEIGNDIVLNTGDATEWATKAPENVWSPIGKAGKAFNGTFDGNMKTISGIYCSETTVNAGLFNKVNLNGEVKNLKIENSYFYNSAGRVAALTGETAAGAKINTVYVGSDVTVVSGGNDTGGIVGYDVGSTITNCWNAATVTSSGVYTGGIIGRVNWGTCTITDCMNTGTVQYEGAEQHSCVGGIVGAEKNGDNTTLNITNVLNLTKPIVISSHEDPGSYSAILGYQVGLGTITNAYDASAFTSNPYNMDAPSSINVADIIGTIGTDVSGTLVGFDFDSVWEEVEGSTPVLSAFQDETPVLWFDISWYGDGTAETFTLTDQEDLYGFSCLSQVNNFAGKTVKLGADITVNTGEAADWENHAPKTEWLPIGESKVFTGNFDGDGHTISGLYMKRTDRYTGLFARVGNSTIANFNLENTYFYSEHGELGGVAGDTWNTTTINRVGIDNNVYIVGNLSNTSFATNLGGFVGCQHGTTSITESWFGGTVKNLSTASRNTGGFVGMVAEGTLAITDCFMTGHLDISYNGWDRVGGFVGRNYKGALTMERCVYNGSYMGSSTKIAFVGHDEQNVPELVDGVYATDNSNVTFKDCYYAGTSVFYVAIDKTADDESNLPYTYKQEGVLGDMGWIDNVWTTADSEVLGSNWTVPTGEYPYLNLFPQSMQSSSVSVASEKMTTWSTPSLLRAPQGGWTDGTYFYQAWIGRSDDSSNNDVTIAKYDLTTYEQVQISDDLKLCHANDITFDETNSRFVVANADGAQLTLTFVDAKTLIITGEKVFTEAELGIAAGRGIYNVTYNADRGCYAVGSMGGTIVILDSDFNKVEQVTSYPMTYMLRGYGMQALASDKDYIYYGFSEPTGNANAIAQYDWEGNFIRVIRLDGVSGELENLSVVGNQIYYALYTDSLSPKAHLYKFDIPAL